MTKARGRGRLLVCLRFGNEFEGKVCNRETGVTVLRMASLDLITLGFRGRSRSGLAVPTRTGFFFFPLRATNSKGTE